MFQSASHLLSESPATITPGAFTRIGRSPTKLTPTMDSTSTTHTEAQEEQANGVASPSKLPQHLYLTETPSNLTMTPSFDNERHRDDDVSDDASTFTFHPVDAPELEVIVSRIFSISFTTRQVPTPISVSDEEDMTSESGDDWFLPYYDSEPQPQDFCQSSVNLSATGEGSACRGSSDDADQQVDGDLNDDDEEEEYGSNKRKEEPPLDHEQLRKRQRIEQEERRARNELWKKSIKRSMFEHNPPNPPVSELNPTL